MDLCARPAPARFAALVAACVVAASGRASAATAGCNGPEVRTDAHVSEPWRRAAATLADDLRALHDVDTCGRVAIFGAGDDVLVEVSLADGRAATRRVTRPDELVATVGSLLLLPPEAAHPEEPKPASASKTSEAPPDAMPAPAAPTPLAVHLEGGVGLAGRVSGAPSIPSLGIGATLFGHVNVSDWLLGVHFRASFVEVLTNQSPSHYRARTAALAATAGRRFRLGALAADLAVGPALVIEHETLDGREIPDSDDVRIAGILRFSSWEAATGARFFGALDVDGSPGRALGDRRRSTDTTDIPDSPTWSAGVTIGIMGAPF